LHQKARISCHEIRIFSDNLLRRLFESRAAILAAKLAVSLLAAVAAQQAALSWLEVQDHKESEKSAMEVALRKR
jgi:hypothetical protein